MIIEISEVSITLAKVRKDLLDKGFLSLILDFHVNNHWLQHFYLTFFKIFLVPWEEIYGMLKVSNVKINW